MEELEEVDDEEGGVEGEPQENGEEVCCHVQKVHCLIDRPSNLMRTPPLKWLLLIQQPMLMRPPIYQMIGELYYDLLLYMLFGRYPLPYCQGCGKQPNSQVVTRLSQPCDNLCRYTGDVLSVFLQ